MRILLPLATALLLSACATASVQAGAASACPIIGSSDWAAWVDAMPGPDRPRLLVTGKATVPHGGYVASLALGAVLEIHPPIQEVELVLGSRHGRGVPVTAMVETHEVRGEFPALQSYGAIRIRCRDQIIAEISPVGRAH